MLTLLGDELGRNLVVLLDDDGLALLGTAMRERFGDDLGLLPDFRGWLAGHSIRYKAFLR